MSANQPTPAVICREDVPLSKIESTLSGRLRDAQGKDDTAVHQARMSNLVIFCSKPEEYDRIESMVPRIVAIHPARILLLLADPSAPDEGVKSSVLIRQLGVGRRLCSEQISLKAGGAAAEHLPFVVRSLLIGDLPTNVWWATNTSPALAGPMLYDLAENAQQVLFDSLGWLEPHRGIASTSTWLSKFEKGGEKHDWRVASDINWRRLKYWRRLLSQGLDPKTAPGVLSSVTEVLIEHGPHAVTQAWQLAGWLAARLGWTVQATKFKPGVAISFLVIAGNSPLRLRIERLPDGPSEVRRVRFAYDNGGEPSALNFVGDGANRLSVLAEGESASPRTVTVQPFDVADLVGRQLSDREPDTIFRETMGVAQVLAHAVLT